MWPRGDNRPESRQAAVIDVGSNSVRLVIYRLDGRAIWTVYNEKALAGLGRDLPSTGRLSPEGVEIALTAIRRFRAVLDGWRGLSILAVLACHLIPLGPSSWNINDAAGLLAAYSKAHPKG